MRKRFCCDASRGMYEDYYKSQSGSGLPVFEGSRGQRGHGLGSMLSGLFRSAMPMIRRGLAAFGRHALKTGLEVANDVVEGQSFSNSARRRVPEGIKRFAGMSDFSGQSGSGRNKSRRRKRAASVKRSKKRIAKKKRYTDIFS